MVEIQRYPAGVSDWMPGSQPLRSLRREAATIAAAHLQTAGRAMQIAGEARKVDPISEAAASESADDALVGVGVLVQIAAELVGTSAELLSGTSPYAGAALLRQVVEVEYLTLAFATEQRNAASWLNSTHRERLKIFSPVRLREVSDGRFRSEDYQHHCEQGGHPVPKAVPLLSDSAQGQVQAQLLLVDLLLHCWRTSDNVVAWSERRSLDSNLVGEIALARKALNEWGRNDPAYRWALVAPPAPPPGP